MATKDKDFIEYVDLAVRIIEVLEGLIDKIVKAVGDDDEVDWAAEKQRRREALDKFWATIERKRAEQA